MAHVYKVELTDTFGGDANYSWVRRETVRVPELVHYGYSGSTDGSYAKACKSQQVALMRLAKAAMGLAGVRGTTVSHGDGYEFRPRGLCQVMFLTYADDETD